MPQRNVWLRREPVGSRTLLPSRDEFRARYARRSLVAGSVAAGSLVALLALRAIDWSNVLWGAFHGAAVIFGIAGVAAGAVALRARAHRREALAGLALSMVAVVGVVFLPQFVGG